MTLHLSQIGLTLGLTFTAVTPELDFARLVVPGELVAYLYR